MGPSETKRSRALKGVGEEAIVSRLFPLMMARRRNPVRPISPYEKLFECRRAYGLYPDLSSTMAAWSMIRSCRLSGSVPLQNERAAEPAREMFGWFSILQGARYRHGLR